MAILRRALPSDAEAMTRLRGFMHLAAGDELTDDWHTRCLETFTRRLPTETFRAYLVEVDGEAVSGGVGWLEEHLPSPFQLDGRRGHISSMSTDPAHRRQGHARVVFGALMAWFSDLDVVRVDLRATEPGQPLYTSFGFRVLGGSTMAWTAPGNRPGMLAP